MGVRLVMGTVFLSVVGSALFIGARCYSGTPSSVMVAIPAGAEGIDGYVRGESLTYLTLPEWFIVYSTDEYGAALERLRPSAFPYLGSARQYWSHYSSVCSVTKGVYPFETGYHVMLGIIGVSFTIENGVKAIYENTIGRVSEWLGSTDTPEDAFARRTAKEYGAFMHSVPWFKFPFGSKIAALWRDVPMTGPHMVRKIERRVALTAEYSVKAVYGTLIGWASGAAYAEEDPRIHARVENAPAAIFSDARVRRVKPLGGDSHIITLPRYEEMTKAVLALTAKGVRFLDIAGNDDILITVLARRGVPADLPGTRLVASTPILTDPTMQRVAISVPVKSLHEVIAHFVGQRATVEHVYDY